MLWTDASSREFIAQHYQWFLDTFDSYTYPIQRADAIRYFILYHYGGVYLDLDVGCKRRLDELLVYPVILPKTIPVGVSNDLMFSEKGHPFMEQTIHNLITFDHNWVLNYPTVMFSTGPMFLSAQYGFWTSSHSPPPDMPGGEIRILPKALYGKNAKPEEAPHAFFSHYYGSSWHADDAAFIGFLGKWGKGLMWIGFFFLVAGTIHLLWKRKSKRHETGYEVLLPRTYQRSGRWHIDFGLFTLTSRGLSSASTSPTYPSSPSPDEDSVPMLPLSLNVRPPSPSSSESSGEIALGGSRNSGIVNALSRASNRVLASLTGTRERPRGRSSSRRRGVLFFLPAIFTPSAVAIPELGSRRPSPTRSATPLTGRPQQHVSSSEKGDLHDLETADVYTASSSYARSASANSTGRVPRPPSPPASTSIGAASSSHVPPPSYSAATGGANPSARPSIWNAEGTWEEWDSR